MARKPRCDLPGSWHHVINRGIAKRPLFERRDDLRFFLARLARQVRLGRIEIHAFSLLTTHYHLLVRSPVGQLSEAMRRAQNEHSRRFNRRNGRDGALVRGRFASKPVRSLAYRRTLVRYIDVNPVKARIVRTTGDYEFGSSASYLSGPGPPWLSREWVESETLARTGARCFSPEAYRAAFGAESPAEVAEVEEFVAVREASSAERDPLDDLVGLAPAKVRAWMERKIRLADGDQASLPVCSPRGLGKALEEQDATRGLWMVEQGDRTWRGADVARVGLLRDLCGLSWQRIATIDGCTISRVRTKDGTHRRLLRDVPTYARRVAQVGQKAIERSLRIHGRSEPPD
jgi:REP element-mobilizing transposase RayT